ncbi:MAG: coenzyme F420-0:L-glutamate ligase [Nitrososphaerota archaeon]|nr:coenzyme F420-0:L-glutamate ligase [Nitrososphaerota archaeon]MDG7020613.1 coenzyme F420-0:L-glutamate ligase [Nitrososphaerota archaeon]
MISRQAVVFIPVRTRRMNARFSLGEEVDRFAGAELQDGDILVISSKFIAISEGRIIDLERVMPGGDAVILSRRLNMPPELCELVIRECDEVVGGVSGFMLTLKEGLLTPNAGIDKSNIEHGRVVLYPRNPFESASSLVEEMRFRRGVGIGVVVSDSRLMPTRKGTVGVALAAAGVEAIVDLRGKPDLFGNVLRVTSQAIADDLCSGAQVLMGEANETVPVVLVRGLGTNSGRQYPMSSFAVDPGQCVYMRSLGYRAK